MAIAIDSRPAYTALLVGNAATYLLAGTVVRRLPVTVPRERPRDDSMLLAVRDVPFLVVTALTGTMALQYVLLEIAVPLWVDRYTSAPRWTVALLYLLNTIACVLFQVRASRRAVDVPSSYCSAPRGCTSQGSSSKRPARGASGSGSARSTRRGSTRGST